MQQKEKKRKKKIKMLPNIQRNNPMNSKVRKEGGGVGAPRNVVFRQ